MVIKNFKKSSIFTLLLILFFAVSSFSNVFAETERSSLKKNTIVTDEGYTIIEYEYALDDEQAIKELEALGHEVYDPNENISEDGDWRLSPIEPIDFEDGGIITRGTSIPSNVWNVANKGRRTISGSSDFYTLYSNYLMTGKSLYVTDMWNKSSKYTTTYSLKTRTKTYYSRKMSTNTGYHTSVSIPKSVKFYARFSGPCNVSGYIE